MRQVRQTTKSIEQVLSPIAEQVSQLIVLDENARLAGVGLPDLTPAAEAVGIACNNLVSVGLSAMESGDDELKTGMPVACEEVSAAGKLFLDATALLKTTPKSDEGRDMMIRAARGLLSGTTNVLVTFDAYEVRKIVIVAGIVLEQLAVIKDITTLEELVPGVQSMNEAMMALAQLAHARSGEMTNSSLRARLENANNTLRKSSPLLLSAMRTFIQNPDNEQAMASKEYAVNQLVAAAQTIITVVESADADEEETVVEAPGAVAASIETAQAQLASSLDVDKVDECIQTVLSNSAQVVEEASATRSDEISDITASLQESLTKFRATKDEAILDKHAGQMQRLLLDLEEKIGDAAVDQLSSAFLADDDDDLLSAVVDTSQNAEGTEDLEAAIAKLELRAQTMFKTADFVASVSMDAKRVGIVRIASKQLLECTEQVATSARVAQQQPDSKAAQEHLALVKSNWKHQSDILRSTVSTMASPDQVVSVAETAISSSMADAARAAQAGDEEGAKLASEAVSGRVQHILTLANAEVENSEDPAYRMPIESAARKLQDATPEYTRDLLAASLTPEDRVVHAQFDMSTEQFRNAVGGMRQAIKGNTAVATTAAAAAGGGEATEPPSRAASSDAELELEIAEPATGPIAEAAQTLKKEADRWQASQNPVITQAKKMAVVMHNMARIANGDDHAKSDIILTSKEIAESGKGIVKHAREVAENCSDKRIKADLLYLCDRIPSISTQLKIISSVKAASHSDDVADSDTMLVNNAQNLMEAVQRLVRACEAASLKQFSATVATANATIRWKRKLRAF